MSSQDFPIEILEMIFKNLKGIDAAACRAVCRRWRDVIDSFSDAVWEHYCSRDFWHPQAANKVSNLSYRELYKSLALWSKVELAEVKCKQLPVYFVSHFKILNNNTLAVLINDIDGFVLSAMCSNTIEYYNIKNMKLISRERFGFRFAVYDENDKLITLVTIVKQLCIVTKSNKKKCFIDAFANYTLLDTEVYFISTLEVMCVARIKIVDGEETIETEELEAFHETVLAFAHAGQNAINILTDEGNIYSYCNNDFEVCNQIDSWTPNIIYELWEFGFHWSNPEIYKWLVSNFDEKQVNITKLKSAVIHSHNHVVVIGTCKSTVHIYKRPYKMNGVLQLYKTKPNRTIDMNKYNIYGFPSRRDIQQLGVVEILNGHRIIVLNTNKLFFVNLLHKQHKVFKRSAASSEQSTSNKKKARGVRKNRTIQPSVVHNNNSIEDNRSPPMKAKRNENVTKKPNTGIKNKKTTNVSIKRVYNTRSMDKCLRSNKTIL